MAGRRWAQGTDGSGDGRRERARPSERGSAAPGPAEPPRTRDGRPIDPDVLRRAQARLEPPRAPWYPLPLAEAGIVLGMVAVLVAAFIPSGRGIIAGFVLIMLGTAEFSWREHRAGYRSHGAVLAGCIGFVGWAIAWELVGLHRNASLGVAVALFLVAWALFDRIYVPQTARERDAAAAPGAGTEDDASASG